jgi:rod shape-determining protein MreD
VPISAVRLEQWLRQTVPFLVAALAILVDLAPRPAPGGGGLGPFLTLAVVYFWCVYRPDLMTYPAVFAIGLAYDLLSGVPLGCTALALVLGRGVLVTRQRFFYAKAFGVIWALFAVLAPAVELLRWGIGVVVTGVVVDPTPLLFQSALTVALYPALSWFLVRLHGRVLEGGHAKP